MNLSPTQETEELPSQSTEIEVPGKLSSLDNLLIALPERSIIEDHCAVIQEQGDKTELFTTFPNSFLDSLISQYTMNISTQGNTQGIKGTIKRVKYDPSNTLKVYPSALDFVLQPGEWRVYGPGRTHGPSHTQPKNFFYLEITPEGKAFVKEGNELSCENQDNLDLRTMVLSAAALNVIYDKAEKEEEQRRLNRGNLYDLDKTMEKIIAPEDNLPFSIYTPGINTNFGITAHMLNGMRERCFRRLIGNTQ